MSVLFSPIRLGSLTLSNRIIVAPMCQYSAESSGEINAWHQSHWMNLALSGAGLLIVEASAVQASGRITYADVGFWNAEQESKIKTALEQVKRFSPMPIGIQLAHAGRKASTDKPWHGGGQIAADQPNGWQPVAPSAISFNPDNPPPKALSVAEIHQVQKDFAIAAERAVRAGFHLIEMHAAHGYLLHQFLSPLSNKREDEYGGGLLQRLAMTLETFKSIKHAVPSDFPVGVRISAVDWMQDGEHGEEQGWDIASSIELAIQLEKLGAAYIHVSSGGLDIQQKIAVRANYQVSFAEAIKRHVSIPVIAVGLITEAQQAEDILAQQQADAIALARAMLYDPRWPWHAAATLKEKVAIAPQYLRCQPHGLKDLFEPFAGEQGDSG